MYLGCEIRVTEIEQRRGWLVGKGHGVQAAAPDESVYTVADLAPTEAWQVCIGIP